MHPSQHGDRLTAVDTLGQGPRRDQVEIDCAARECLGCARLQWRDIADIGETLRTQQLLGDI
jgi:hypothetical protein